MIALFARRIEFSVISLSHRGVARQFMCNAQQRVEVIGHQQPTPAIIYYAGDPVDKKKEKLKKQKKEKEDAKKNKSTPVTKDEKPSGDKKK
jgi:hypothetical protein